MNNINLIEHIKEYIQIIKNNKNNDYIDINECDFLSPTLMLPLLIHDKEIIPPNNKKIKEYYEVITNDYQNKDTTLKLKEINNNKDNSDEITKEIINVINPENKLNNALKYMFYELINNIYDHSEFNKGYVFGQKYPNIRQNEFSFMDNGITIQGSFKKAEISFKNDCDAIIQAVNGKSSKNIEKNYVERGTGLNSIINMITKGANGKILLCSGTCAVEFEKNKPISKLNIPEDYIKGTLISVKFPIIKELNATKYYDYKKIE